MARQITVNDTAAGAAAGEPAPIRHSWFGRIRRRIGVARTLGLISVLDATILPSPVEMLMIAGMLAKRDRVWPIATYVTLGCIVGCTLSYLAGALLFDVLAVPLVERMGATPHLQAALNQFRDNDWLAIFVITMTPIPLPFAPLAAGATGMNPFFAIGLITVIRGVRYYGIAWLIDKFGPQIAPLYAKMSGPWVTIVTLAIGAAAIIVLFVI